MNTDRLEDGLARFLADLVLAGVNQALKNSQDLMQSKLGGAMGGLKGLGLPGL